jgi:hypothetical protein
VEELVLKFAPHKVSYDVEFIPDDNL